MTVDRSSPAYARVAASLLEVARAREVARVRAYRADLDADIDRVVLALRAPELPPSDRLRAAMLASVELVPAGNTPLQRLRNLQRREPTIVKRLTYSGCFAIGAEVPATTCRWCVAYRFARKPRRVKGQTWTILEHRGDVPHELPRSHRVALRRALGRPCGSCTAVMTAHDTQTSRSVGTSTRSTASASGPAGQRTTRDVTTVSGITAGVGGPTYAQARAQESGR